MTGKKEKHLAKIRGIFESRQLSIHIGYWIFYILFFTIQRFAFYGYIDFIPNLKLNLAYLPIILISTYLVSEYIIPNLFNSNNLIISGTILVLIIITEPFLAYLTRIYIIEPYIYNDHRVYNLYNYLTAILIFVFGAVPVAGLKIARLLRAHYLHHQKVEHDKLEAELKLKESELKLLKWQIQPHFLFNTLNNLYLLALEKSDKTPDLVLRLSEMLSYITYDCSAEKIPLDKEIEFLNSFIELERIRSETCAISLKISGNTGNVMIAPMILHTFIDNSFKYSDIKEKDSKGIKISLSVNNNILNFSAENSRKHENGQSGKKQGIGISNTIKRLNLIYPDRHVLTIKDSDDRYSVFLRINT
jgi:two-component system, LytTR family, sensor kinase